MLFLHVDQVHALEGYTLRLEFNDGATRDVDLSDQLHGVVFEPLKDMAFFRRVAINFETGTIEWPNGADFAPEFLYEIGRAVHQVA
ncbi:DUF2442 domain-containing protein [Longimicrobium sp.]|uniref:DUF2442 domain-containing protein n=1 Tax=Longimicrobium sp. TaxID=2029185 RepID=UPI003B3A7558